MDTQMSRQLVALRKSLAAVPALEVLHPVVRHIDVLAQSRLAWKRRLALIAHILSDAVMHPLDVLLEMRLSQELAPALLALQQLRVLLVVPRQLVLQREAHIAVLAPEGLAHFVYALDVARETAFGAQGLVTGGTLKRFLFRFYSFHRF